MNPPVRPFSFQHHRESWRYGLLIAAFGALWYVLIARLAVYWSISAEYSFGWFGPLICAYLFFFRWMTRPRAEPARSAVPKGLFWLAGVAFLPTWLVEQPYPDWRLIIWLLALEVVVLSLCAVYFVGGRPWLKHFGFSICMILATVPWEGDMEHFVTQGLMLVVTSVTVAALNLVHIQALQHGNLIELKTGLLGIAEACSGIRSLQATLMVSLFLGELYRATWPRRLLLVICGSVVAFICNVGRAFLLAAVAAHDGLEAISKWHDPAGFIILGICFVVVWGLAHLLSGGFPQLQRSSEPATNLVPWRLVVGLGVWVLCALLGTEAWYRGHEGRAGPHWSFQWPVSNSDFSNVALSPVAEGIGFDEGRAATWTDRDGTQWTAFLFKWAAGPVRSRILARVHRPENCFPQAGYKLKADRGTIGVQTNGLTLPFHALEFDFDGKPAHVFFCLWQDGLNASEQSLISLKWTRWSALRAVLRGERNLGQEVLEVVIIGYPTLGDAEIAFRQRMGELIRS
ncbi:MAG: exosortase/archaeosortase family protein [Verrucomicrobia bacterium]|nr:exosortase/archaeosortase family protein [Verrucomicrobiota bacterium]